MSTRTELDIIPERTIYRKSLVALMGIPLMGKTTVGNELTRRTNFIYLDGDVARRRIFVPVDEQGDISDEIPPDVNPEDILNGRDLLPGQMERAAMLLTYQANHETARSLLNQGQPVILGASYSQPIYHEMLTFLAEKTDSPIRAFLLDASDRALEGRLMKRLAEGSMSNVRTIEHILADKRRYKRIESIDVTVVDTAKPLQYSIEQILDNLRDLRV